MYMQLLLKQSVFYSQAGHDRSQLSFKVKSLSLEATTDPYKRSSDRLLLYCPLKPQAL